MLKMMIRMDDDKITTEKKYHWTVFTVQSIIHSLRWDFFVLRMVLVRWYIVTVDAQGISACLGK